MTVAVPFGDLRRQAAAIADELEDGFAAVLASGRFVGGPALERFEGHGTRTAARRTRSA
jgi:hypothetical protein